MSRGLVAATCAALLGSASPGPALAQEFVALPLPAESAARMLERGLPPATPGARFESSWVSWFGLRDLATEAAAVGGSWGGARAAVGAARTGTAEVGWSTLAVAGGWADARSGAALRAVVRGQGGEGAWRGAEAGAGAWADAGRGVRLWASAPQLWQGGEAPPLERRLELGASLEAGELELWLVRRAAPGARGALRGEHTAGLAAHAGVLMLWTHVEDAPARGGFGLAIAWRGLRLAMGSDTHPILGETLELSLAMGADIGGAP